jgi:phenol/toluene 2-monooxygenase (NADH) P0/A0
MIPMIQREEFRDGGFDPSRRFVRVRRVRDDGFVEFEFAIGDPDMFVEMILPQQALPGFCTANDVILLDVEPSSDESAARQDERWTLGDATRQRFRSPLRE